MKCLFCGKENNNLLCENCITLEALAKTFTGIATYKEDYCENEYIKEYVSSFETPKDAFSHIPELLELFDIEIAEFYWCRYYYMSKDELFENTAIAFLEKHAPEKRNYQVVLYSLLSFYGNDNFIKPGKWCEIISSTDNLYCDMYQIAAEYYAKIGEYDVADNLVKKALSYCNDPAYKLFIYSNREKKIAALNKLAEKIITYRTKKPYWPTTEERRRAVAMFYDEKGISYPRIESKPTKIPEKEFEPINECLKNKVADYCAFWCCEAFSVATAKSLYQIAAVKVKAGEIIDEFQSFIRPWDGSAGRIAAAKDAGVELSVIESADDVDLVMTQFFNFVAEDILVSTDALGNQAKLISRAARYSGMREIKNEFLDLLDLAADISSNFDLSNNTRDYLIEYFNILEGADALSKAKANVLIYNNLLKCGKLND